MTNPSHTVDGSNVTDEQIRALQAENERLLLWQARASQVLPLVTREAGTELAEFVGKLLRDEIPASTGAPDQLVRRAQNDAPVAVQRVVMSWLPPQ